MTIKEELEELYFEYNKLYLLLEFDNANINANELKQKLKELRQKKQ